MFRIIFVALTGREREIILPANSEREAIMTAATLRDFGLVLTCTKLDTLEDWAVQDHRLRSSQMGAAA